MSSKEIASRLVISPKTARNHIEHIYTKIGATSRVTASLFAKGKGVFFNDLLELDWAHSSPINLNLDLCARVKITRVEEGQR